MNRSVKIELEPHVLARVAKIAQQMNTSTEEACLFLISKVLELKAETPKADLQKDSKQ